MDNQLFSESPLGRWLLENGGSVNGNLRWKREASGHRLEATAPIHASDELVRLPYSLAITPSLVRTFLPEVMTTRKDLSNHEVMCLYLCLHGGEVHESVPETALKHTEYINTLPSPQQMRTAMWFTEQEQDLLIGSNLYGAIHTRRQEWQAELHKITHADILSPKLTANLTWEKYLWACSILSSRSFPSYLLDGKREDATQILLPCVDAFNHKRAQQVTWLSDHATSHMQLITDADIEAGQEVFNNYGIKPNDELLMGYGFVLEDNPDDFLSLRMGAKGVPAADKLLSELGLPLTKMHYVGASVEELPSELLSQMRVLVADEDEMEELKTRLRDTKCGTTSPSSLWQTVLQFVSWPNELEMLAQLHVLLRTKLQSLEQALERTERAGAPLKKRKLNTAASPPTGVIRADVLDNIAIYLKGQVKILKHCISLAGSMQQESLRLAAEAGYDIEAESASEEDSD